MDKQDKFRFAISGFIAGSGEQDITQKKKCKLTGELLNV